ncbi:MAG: hypothetical protein AAGD11_17290 [Planctomycetota bacterium]
MNSRSTVKMLLGFVLGLPVVMAVLHWVEGLLTAMEDSSAASVLGYISTAFGVLWLLAVVGLVIAMALETLDDGENEDLGE